MTTNRPALLALLLPLAACTPPAPPAPISAPASAPSATVQVSAPAVPAALSEEAYRCELLVEGAPARMIPGGTAVVAATITNQSKETWPAKPAPGEVKAVYVASRWYDSAKKKVLEGERSHFPADPGPAASNTLPVKLKAPTAHGKYTLIVEPVHEGVTWFADKGGCKQEFTISVGK